MAKWLDGRADARAGCLQGAWQNDELLAADWPLGRKIESSKNNPLNCNCRFFVFVLDTHFFEHTFMAILIYCFRFEVPYDQVSSFGPPTSSDRVLDDNPDSSTDAMIHAIENREEVDEEDKLRPWQIVCDEKVQTFMKSGKFVLVDAEVSENKQNGSWCYSVDVASSYEVTSTYELESFLNIHQHLTILQLSEYATLKGVLGEILVAYLASPVGNELR